MRRRELLKAAVAATGGLAAASLMRPAKARDFLKPDAAAKGLTVYQKDDSILIRFDNLPVVAYRAQPSLKYPYFCPLNGPASGLSLTTESAIPYPTLFTARMRRLSSLTHIVTRDITSRSSSPCRANLPEHPAVNKVGNGARVPYLDVMHAPR